MSDWVTKEKVNSLKKIGQHIEPTEDDYAYIAGIIDSEGCFRIKKWKPKDKPNYVYAINLEIGNKRFPIFPWLTERFGGNTVFFKQVWHPGTKANPFHERAYKSVQTEVEGLMTQYGATVIEMMEGRQGRFFF